MRKTIISIVIIIVTLFLFLLVYEFKSQEEQFFYVYHLNPQEIESLEEGDIILRHGYGLVSDLIVETLKEKYPISHCGIICKRDNKFIVVHTVSSSLSDFDGMQYQDLKTFVLQSRKNSIIVTRLKLPREVREKISQLALYYLEQKIPFDHSFDIDDSSFYYCSELLWRIILRGGGIDIFHNRDVVKKTHLYFSHFYNPEFFDIIINHHDSARISFQREVH